MSEPTNQLYHCSKCDSVFKAPVPYVADGLCPHCGQTPVSQQDFNSIFQMEKIVDSDETHGVAGHDVAVFVSMQKVKRNRQGKWALVLWMSLLVVGGGIVFYNRELEIPISIEPSEFVKQEKKDKETLARESREALRLFDRYMVAASTNEKSEYVLGGVRKILNIEQKEAGLDFIVPRPPLRLLANSYSDEGEMPRVEFLLEDKSRRRFEVVMWKKDLVWKLDWEQHVRYAESSWSQFLANQTIGNPKEFRLYVRRRHVGAGRERTSLELIFYKPKMTAGERSQESPQVNVTKDSALFAQLDAAFDAKSSKKDEDRTSAMGLLDTAGFLRVKAILDWQQGLGEDPVMVLKDLSATHWFELDPSKNSSTGIE
jgi:hypothetical protein